MLAFVIAQVLDYATFHPSRELNPIVLAVAENAVWLKVTLIAIVTVTVIALMATRRYTRAIPVVLGLGTVAGALGAATNVMAR